MFFSESRGGTWLLPLPLVAQSVPMLPRRWMLVVCSSIVAAFGLVVYVDTAGNWQTVTEASFLYLPAVVFVVVFMQVVVREQNARAEIERLLAELGQANHKLGEYAAQVEELATIKERNRLAREIHDTIGHYLTVVNVQLEAAQTIFDSDPRHALEAVRKAKSLVQEGLSEVRRSVAALRASALDERSLREAMAALVEEIRVAGLISEFTIRGETRPLRSQEKLTLYRVAQEGLTNVRKHAHATRVDLTLDYESVSEVRLVVKDNGVGSAAADGGFGLLGLRERVRLLNGQLQVTTASGQGFTLEVALPG
jgi:signal transduction histidine kinase